MQKQAADSTTDNPNQAGNRLPAVRALPGARMKVAAHARNAWHVTIPETAKYEDVFDIKFWQVVEKQFTSGDLIEVTDDAGTFWALLMVRAHVQAFAL